MYQTLSDRFAYAVRRAGITNMAEFAREVGVKPSALYQIRDGKTRSLAAETALRIARRTGVRSEWLVLGEQPVQRETESRPAPSFTHSIDPDKIAAVYELIEDALAAANAYLLPEGRGHVFAAAYGLLVEGHNRDVIAKTVQGLLRGFARQPKGESHV